MSHLLFVWLNVVYGNMTIVDCAHDDGLALELLSYIIQDGHQAKLDDCIITINEKNTKKIIESFLKDTKKQGYSIVESDADVFVVAKPTSLENIGFMTCDYCGKTFSSKEKLDIHKIVHGQGMRPVN